ncbi:MAG: hypothetical protein P8Q57_07230 [Yoonia sp.]|nr:hypothetical protein [Yoonia sp.]
MRILTAFLFMMVSTTAQAQVVVIDCGGSTGIHGISSVIKENPSEGFEIFLGKEVIPSVILDDNLRPVLALRSGISQWNVIDRRGYDSTQNGALLTFLVREGSTSGTMQFDVATKIFFHAASDMRRGKLFARYAQCK